MTDNELKERAIEFLMASRESEIKPNEFPARELMTVLKCSEANVYARMDKYLRDGTWGTRKAFDPELNKTVRVWWLIE